MSKRIVDYNEVAVCNEVTCSTDSQFLKSAEPHRMSNMMQETLLTIFRVVRYIKPRFAEFQNKWKFQIQSHNNL